MAPSYDAARSLQSGGRRPIPIVPVVPLPYTQKRKLRETAPREPTGGDGTISGPANGTVTEELPGASSGVNGVQVGGDQADLNIEDPHGRLGSTKGEIPSVENSTHVQEVRESNKMSPGPQTPAGDSQHGQIQQYPPPPFPPQQASGPSSATSSNFSHPPPHYHQPMGHHPQLSNGSMVFGGFSDSSNPSPGPPSNISLPQYHPQMPAFINPPFAAPLYPPAHSQHVSDPNIPVAHPSANQRNYMPRPDLYIPFRPEQGYPNLHGRPMNFAPPEGYSPFSSTGTPVDGEGKPLPLSNNLAHPHQPSNAQPNQHMVEATHPNFALSQNGNKLQQFSADNHRFEEARNRPDHLHRSEVDELAGLRDLRKHLLSQFSDSTTADYSLELHHGDSRFDLNSFPVHSLLLIRSPTLQGLLQSNPKGSSSGTLRLETKDRFVSPQAFEHALRYLYGGELLNFEKAHTKRQGYMNKSQQSLSEDDMDHALAYAASGHLLQISQIVERGAHVASGFSSWESAQKALSFALEGGPSSNSGEASDRDVGQTAEYGPPAERLLHDTLNYITLHFSPNFVLDTSIPEMSNNPRLPIVKGTRSSKHNPRLSLIHFGDHPSEDLNTSLSPHTILSSILLSLPFGLLQRVLESPELGAMNGHLHFARRQDIVRAVIGEREKRRLEILRSRGVSNVERRDRSSEWNVVGWEESVSEPNPNNPETIAITQSWKGFSNPQESKGKV
ncbi:MAG: hypothetical protein M4579_003991 [Chaenotheca gracillima]|nr:MAG: hypothetical protein M4579_003991 [Chaenotheca gracillima]